jgi:hypothetical protein
MDGHIAFIGDSFCADYVEDNKQLLYTGFRPQNLWRQNLDAACWPSILANKLNLQIANFGFGGTSWWYGWHMFLKHYWRNSAIDQNKLQAIIFCHTDHRRIPTTNIEILKWHQPGEYHCDGVEYYRKHLEDYIFLEWAREQYFLEIRRTFTNIKTLHLFCFDKDISHRQCLPGMQFTDPLMWVSLGELLGTKDEILNQLTFKENRKNHLSDANNRILAELMYEAIKNYSPGVYDLNIGAFELRNSNYQNWPDGDFGTK